MKLSGLNDDITGDLQSKESEISELCTFLSSAFPEFVFLCSNKRRYVVNSNFCLAHNLPLWVGWGSSVEVLYWLSGLTCTDENFIAKSGAQRAASKEGIALIAPDTSPSKLSTKETSSTSVMRESVETSLLLKHRAQVLFFSVQRHQMCYWFYWSNAVLIARDRKAASLLLQRMLFHFPPGTETDLDSYVLDDRSILQDAGIKEMKDVESLSLPSECKDANSIQKYAGDVSYLICTRACCNF